MDAGEKVLTSLDWGVIMVYGVGMIVTGIYFSRRNKSTEDYMLGGRTMSSWRVGLSFFATLFSAVTYLSLPGEMIKNGPMIWSMAAALPFIYWVVAYYLIPFIMKLKITSAYELLETELDLKNRMLAVIYFLVMRFVWMAVIIFLVSFVLVIPYTIYALRKWFND